MCIHCRFRGRSNKHHRRWYHSRGRKRGGSAAENHTFPDSSQQRDAQEHNCQPRPSPSMPFEPFVVVAIYNFNAASPSECSFSQGDLLRVLDSSNNWWIAKNFTTKREGLIPSNYVTEDMSRSIVTESFYDVNRMEAERKLLVPGVNFGTFLLRPCEQPRSPYSLSVRAHGVSIKHFQVFYDIESHQFHLSNGRMFASLEELISFHLSNLIDNEVGLSEPRMPRVVPPMNFEDIIIKYADLRLGRELGRGNFGAVYLGYIRNVEVAVKKSLTAANDEALHEEARVMHILSHPRIVRFLGYCCDAPDGHVLIITEFMALGALLGYLHSVEGQGLTYEHLISIIDQVVKAMVYLETVGVVHRDLRAANVLVDADGSVRVADFGLTKIYGFDQNHTSGAFPFRWTAPEAMQASPEVDTKADVWSFGVLMFEVLTYGRTPYEDCKSYSEVKNFLSSGGRLPSPRSIGFQCENAVYVIMQSCWMMQPAMRPSFRMLSTRIEESIIDREGRYSPPFNKAWEN